MQMKLHCALGDSERCGCLCDGQAVDIEQRKRQPLLARQTCEHCRDIVELGGLYLYFWLSAEAVDDSLLARLTAMFVAHVVDGDPANPAHWVVIRHDRAPLQVSFHERHLHRVGSDLLVAACHGECANETPVMGAEERFEIVDHSYVVHHRDSHW